MRTTVLSDGPQMCINPRVKVVPNENTLTPVRARLLKT